MSSISNMLLSYSIEQKPQIVQANEHPVREKTNHTAQNQISQTSASPSVKAQEKPRRITKKTALKVGVFIAALVGIKLLVDSGMKALKEMVDQDYRMTVIRANEVKQCQSLLPNENCYEIITEIYRRIASGESVEYANRDFQRLLREVDVKNCQSLLPDENCDEIIAEVYRRVASGKSLEYANQDYHRLLREVDVKNCQSLLPDENCDEIIAEVYRRVASGESQESANQDYQRLKNKKLMTDELKNAAKILGLKYGEITIQDFNRAKQTLSKLNRNGKTITNEEIVKINAAIHTYENYFNPRETRKAVDIDSFGKYLNRTTVDTDSFGEYLNLTSVE